jgi:phosphopantothenoylcysteine decarboxylase
MPVVALVVCGAPLTRRTGDMVNELVSGGWDVRLVGTPTARSWIDLNGASSLRGVVPRFDFVSPEHPRSTADPDIVTVCPATFNTLNKVATGIADNYATSLICETLGMRNPVLAVPMVNHKLWGHPALSSSVTSLSGAGVKFLDVQTGAPGLSPVQSGSGDHVVRKFQPSWLLAAVRSIS